MPAEIPGRGPDITIPNKDAIGIEFDLGIAGPLAPDVDASYALPVRQAGTLLTASFRFRIAPDTLAVRLAVPITRARRGLSPPSHRSDTIPTKRASRHSRHAWRTSQRGAAWATPPVCFSGNTSGGGFDLL